MRILIVSAALLMLPAIAEANCLGNAALPSDEIAKFKVDPSLYLANSGSTNVAATVQKLAASDPSTIQGIQGAIGGKPLPVQTSITEGLAAAAQACVANNPEQARSIQLAAADLQPNLRSVFERYNGQREVALTGASAGASPGSSGGQTVGDGVQGGSNAGSDAPNQWSVANKLQSLATIASSGRDRDNGNGDSSRTTIIINNPSVPNPTSP